MPACKTDLKPYMMNDDDDNRDLRMILVLCCAGMVGAVGKLSAF